MFALGDDADLRSGGVLGRVATLFRAVRDERAGQVIALDNGDTFHGTMAAVHTRGEAMIAPMRALGLDGMTAHWEFAYGLPRVGEIAERLTYPILAANYHHRASSMKLPPFTVVERGGLRVGIIGLAAILAPHHLPHDQRSGLEVTIGDEELRALIPTLRREGQVDIIVVLSHLGFPQDCKLVSAVPGIDVLLSGHTHNRLEAPVVIGDTLIMQSGAHGSFVGRLDLTVAGDGIAEWSHALVPVDDTLEPDAEMSALVDEALRPFADARATVVGETTCTLTEWDLWNIVPANPPVSVVTLTGLQLRTLFENNIEATFACDPWQQRGGYLKRCRGVELLVKLENPAGHRIQALTVEGARIGDAASIDVAFLGEQAVPADAGSHRRSAGITAVDAFVRYVHTQQTVTPALRGSITIV